MTKKIFTFFIYFFLIIYFLLIIAIILKKNDKKITKENSRRTGINNGFQDIALKQPQKNINKEAIVTYNYYVSPEGSDENHGNDIKNPFFSIQKAINLAKPGERIYLLPGVYYQDVETVRDGMINNPIEIVGSKEAIVKGGGRTNIISINHSYISLNGFTIDGKFKRDNSFASYRDKLIFISGQSSFRPTTNVLIKNMILKNARGECVRLKYFSQKNEISYSQITNCGVGDFVFKKSGKNGEGIYIGTAPEQLKTKNPTTEIDRSDNNWIHHNTIDTQGNECVDIKEASSGNIIEYNDCTGQKDPESGGMDSRGNNNVFRFNTISNNLGAGIRLGGDTETDGTNNFVYGNIIIGNEGGGIKVQTFPQGQICENTLIDNIKGEIVGKFKKSIKNESKCF